jgi:hypothetical protein
MDALKDGHDGWGVDARWTGRWTVALTETTASIRGAVGNITIYRKHNRPALGPPGDSLDDLQ